MKENILNKITEIDLNLWLLFAILLTHIIYFVAFFINNIIPMIYFNIYSIVNYIVCIILYILGSKKLAFILAFIEVYFHQALGAYYIGYNSGFLIVFTCLFFLEFTFFKNIFIRSLVGCFLIFSIFISYHYDRFFIGYYNEKDIFFYVNIIISSMLMMIFGTLATLGNNKKISDLMNLIYKDFLTGLYNRKYFEEKIISKINKNHSILIAICDIDNFKNINDIYGHDVGDIILKKVANTIQHELLELNGIVSRWGGEEFIIKIDTNENMAEKIIENLRILVSKQYFKQYNIYPTITIGGIFIYKPNKDKFEEYFKIADNELYHGKKTGKNKISIKYLNN